jgi:hypothetical protein
VLTAQLLTAPASATPLLQAAHLTTASFSGRLRTSAPPLMPRVYRLLAGRALRVRHVVAFNIGREHADGEHLPEPQERDIGQSVLGLLLQCARTVETLQFDDFAVRRQLGAAFIKELQEVRPLIASAWH